ncbi:MAG: NERD domain-containing protein [Alphaproteobacteria bacterium]|nr:NERD domain-containing protein [Alphaproteobacteria bacterium]
MRRFAGSWVRSQARERLILIVAAMSVAGGFALHWLFSLAVHLILHPGWVAPLTIGIMAASLIGTLLAGRSMDRGRIARWLKGAESEEEVGQAIERALTARGCAVAHSVTALTGAGDIDHLVLTPAGLTVVETKYRRVPRKRFPNVLSALAGKVKDVRAWAPPGTPVRAILVLANPDGTRRWRYEAADEAVAVHTPGSLAKALATDAASDRAVAPGLAEAVWGLGSELERTCRYSLADRNPSKAHNPDRSGKRRPTLFPPQPGE